jgi:hypothetical protein
LTELELRGGPACGSVRAGQGAEGAAPVLQCAECKRLWIPLDADHWSAYLTDDEPPEVAFFCPRCAEREFGGA